MVNPVCKDQSRTQAVAGKKKPKIPQTLPYRKFIRFSMVFFGFVASFRPEVRRLLQRYPAICPMCANPTLKVAEVDKVLRIFFLPVWRSKVHYLMVVCQNCGFMIEKSWMDELEARRKFFADQIAEGLPIEE